jgi:hypothetical protein
MAKTPNQAGSGAADLLMKIARCHRLARETPDSNAVRQLMDMAAEYERQLRQPSPLPEQTAGPAGTGVAES